MKPALSVASILLFVSVSGCGQDYSLSPPADSEQITVTVKVPKELEAETMQVMYRSATCKRITHGASGQRIELEGYHSVDVQLQRQGASDLYQASLPKELQAGTMQVMYRSTLCTFTDHSASGKPYERDGQPVRQGQSDLYEARLAVHGGGSCQWRLSNVTFGVTYANPAQFGENVSFGTGGGVVVVFDNNNSPRGGTGIKVDGELTIKKDYYPWIDEEFLGPYKKTVSLAGEGSIYLSYQALQAQQVYFEPVLHADFVVHSAGPKVKKKANHTVFTYPDGRVAADGRSRPDFKRCRQFA